MCLEEEHGGVHRYCLCVWVMSMDMYLETACLEEEYGNHT